MGLIRKQAAKHDENRLTPAVSELVDQGVLQLFVVNRKPFVAEVIPGTPAAKAGLKSGDVFLAVGETRTLSRDKFVAAVQKHEVGARVKIKLRRLKQELVVYVQLVARPTSSGAGAVAVVEESAAAVVRRSARKPMPLPSTPIAEVAPPAMESSVARAKGYLGVAVRQGDGGMLQWRLRGNHSPLAQAFDLQLVCNLQKAL